VLLYRLKPLDIEVMKQLHHKVNIIPLIAKADTMTADECRDFKKTVSFSFLPASAGISIKDLTKNSILIIDRNAFCVG